VSTAPTKLTVAGSGERPASASIAAVSPRIAAAKPGDRVEHQPAELLPGLGVDGDVAQALQDRAAAGPAVDGDDLLAAAPAGQLAVDPGGPAEQVDRPVPDRDADDEDDQREGRAQRPDPDAEGEHGGPQHRHR
jgi:hypothetical protein